MNLLSFRTLFLFIILLSSSIVVCEAQSFDRPPAPKQSKGIAKKGPLRTKNVKIRGPKSVEKAKKKADAKDSKRKKDFKKYVRENQKRSIEIQTPEVKERMKQNIKDADARYKAKKKRTATTTRRAGGKYR